MNGKDLENIPVEEYTTPSPCVVKETDGIKKVVKLMEENEIRHIPVVNGKGEAVGVISDRDAAVVRSFAFKADLTASDLMSKDPVTAHFNSSLLEAVYQMSSRKIGSIIVTDDEGGIYGIFTNTDALNALIEVLRGDTEGERDQIQDY